ncbi:MAG: thymidine phosphorylase, partial [Limisphaerales bacterium]
MKASRYAAAHRTVNFVNLIESKRDGLALKESDIQALVAASATEQIPDYQLAAFLMAVFFRGMTPDECATMTLAMRDSGRVLEWPEDERPVVDKHSTGGVGDKVSLVLAPVLACLGFRV